MTGATNRGLTVRFDLLQLQFELVGFSRQVVELGGFCAREHRGTGSGGVNGSTVTLPNGSSSVSMGGARVDGWLRVRRSPLLEHPVDLRELLDPRSDLSQPSVRWSSCGVHVRVDEVGP